MIELRSISKSFGNKAVLKPLDLSFERGKTHVLLGLSGSGKSSLLRIIMGLLRPDQGTMNIDGKDVRELNRQNLAQLFGFVPQKAALYPHLTAKQNVLLPAEVQRIEIKSLNARLQYLLKLLHLEEYLLNQFPFQLSGGQQQRFSVMRALLLDPPYLLMDESLSALDPIIRSDLQENLKQIFKDLNKTVIFVTHDLHEARHLGDKLYLLHDGKVLQSGSFADLKERPADDFVRKFISAQSDL